MSRIALTGSGLRGGSRGGGLLNSLIPKRESVCCTVLIPLAAVQVSIPLASTFTPIRVMVLSRVPSGAVVNMGVGRGVSAVLLELHVMFTASSGEVAVHTNVISVPSSAPTSPGKAQRQVGSLEGEGAITFITFNNHFFFWFTINIMEETVSGVFLQYCEI